MRQELFADRIWQFDDVLTDFYNWIPAIRNLWLLCLVFQPEGPEAEHLRAVLTSLWRIYVVCYPTWRAQQRKHDRQKQQYYRALKSGWRIAPSVRPAHGTSVGLAGRTDVVDSSDVDARLNLERASKQLDANEQHIFDLITEGSGVPFTPQQIAEHLGMPVDEVDGLTKQMTSRLADLFSDFSP